MRPVVELSAIATPHSFMRIMLRFRSAGTNCCVHHAVVAVVISESVSNLLQDYGSLCTKSEGGRVRGGRLEVCRQLRS